VSAAHQLLKSSRAAQGLPATLEDVRACEQIAALLGQKEEGPRTAHTAGGRPDDFLNTTADPTRGHG
jgi:hypothetical protein